VRLVDRVPLHALAPTCAAVIDHGGWGTVLTALTAGAPQVVVPTWFDNPLVGRRLAEQGAAVALDQGADAAAVAAATRRLLAEPSFGANGARLRAEIGAMPPPCEIVEPLADLAGAR
jgi:UDP:flavonoid glycosyltransferase YjiC (YdhE family)